jgi:hypothetical protein
MHEPSSSRAFLTLHGQIAMSNSVPPQLQPFMVNTKLGPVLPADDRLSDYIMTLPAAEQDAVIATAQRFVADVRTNGTTPEYFKPFGPDGRGAPFEQVRAAIIDHFCKNVAKIMRVRPRSALHASRIIAHASRRQYAQPTRIADAVPYLESVLEHYAKNNTSGPAKDITPMLHLSVALSCQPGKEDDALRVFMDASEGDPMGSNSRTLLWARANMARMLRKQGKDKLAQEQEDMVVCVHCGSVFRTGDLLIRRSATVTGCSAIRMECHRASLSSSCRTLRVTNRIISWRTRTSRSG